MDRTEYLNAMPKLHSWDGGKSWNTGGFTRTHMDAFMTHIERVSDRPRIIETGAGNSTIAFTFCNPDKVVTINPDAGVYTRIKDFCAANDISLSRNEMILGRSQWILPRLASEAKTATFDAALLDGDHGWPLAFVDLFYINFLVKSGGLIIVDDIALYSVREMARFLLHQPGFELVEDLGKALVFKKTTARRELERWVEQPYIKDKSPDDSPLMPPVISWP